MRKIFVLLAVMASALVLIGGSALAESDGEARGRATVEPLEAEVTGVPTDGLTDPLTVRNGRIEPAGDEQRQLSTTAAATPEWLDGSYSATYFWNPVLSMTETLTMEWIGYWGTEDTSYPKVGDLYYGRVVIGNVSPSVGTSVIAEVELPPNTRFAIDPANQNTRVRCILEDFNTGQQTELTGANCTQSPTQGIHGWHFAPDQGYWNLVRGKALIIIFPIYSTAELRGIAATPADCMIGSVWAAAGIDPWDAPGATDTCPLPQNHGVWQGVFVPFNPPTISYPSPSASNVTMTGARTTANLFSHFDPGTAFVELGETTAYGATSSLQVPGTQDSFVLNTDWTGLEPGTTYHWRLRFVDNKGRTFTGADQTFTTSADATAPGGTVRINGGAAYTRSAAVTLALSASDPSPGSGVASMRFKNDGGVWSAWEGYSTSKSWALANGDGTRTVYVQYRDGAGNPSRAALDKIKLDTTRPTVSGMSPGHKTAVADTTPTIRATVKDNMTNLKKGNIKLLVNGQVIPRTRYAYDDATDGLRYDSPKLPKGRTTVRIVATDAAKNVGARGWYFTIR